MTLEEILHYLGELAERHWSQLVLTLGGLWLGAWWVRRAARQWKRKEFLDRLNVSLNILADGKLQLRTILEEGQEAILLNKVAVDKIQTASKKTTEANPLLPLEPDDAWYLLNAVLNEISERIPLGHLKRDMGQPTQAEKYLLALTFECAGAMRTRKVRAMMIKKSTLLNLPKKLPTFENPWHETRFRTLQAMAVAYEKTPHLILEMEVCV